MPPSLAASDPLTAGLITLVTRDFLSAIADNAERNQQSPVPPCMISNGLNPSTMNSPSGLKMSGYQNSRYSKSAVMITRWHQNARTLSSGHFRKNFHDYYLDDQYRSLRQRTLIHLMFVLSISHILEKFPILKMAQ